MRSMSRAALALLLAVPLASCARNAVLEVEITLPPQPAGESQRYAVVQFATEPQEFEADWAGNGEFEGVALGEAPSRTRFSIVTETDTTVVLVKVLFCRNPTCDVLEDDPRLTPAAWYRLERSFYLGARTRWSPEITEVPAGPDMAPELVDKCEIEGCIRAGSADSNFCRLSGEHFCE
jgi:hypothetical protein